MIYIVDLSAYVDPKAPEIDPVRRTVVGHQEGAHRLANAWYKLAPSRSQRLVRRFLNAIGKGVKASDFPDGEALSLMRYSLTTHTGTHIDSPSHYGSKNSQTVCDLPLEKFYKPGFCLDVKGPGNVITLNEIKEAVHRIGYRIQRGDIALLNTGQESLAKQGSLYFQNYRGISAEGVRYLLDKGVEVIGIDTFSFDPPFEGMLSEFLVSRNKDALWPAHVLGREKPYIQIERLENLDDLPKPFGFKVSCLPIKLLGADASWCRAVAIFEES